ncbi:MAG: UvrD-helicase domain-containing protein [Chitinispirillaceae bacterium]|nr:UvrD-helicase domain-containing protein [Chitinispirillaceae bacterium]
MTRKPDPFAGLNPSQKKAVCHTTGPLLVLAGAGSGKTRVLTLRIARLVADKKCTPGEILALTFTNKAAKEMRERIAALTSQKAAEAMTVSTFHSLGVKILREDGHLLGLKRSFSILGDHERTATLRTVIRSSGIRGLKDEDPDKLANRISLAKNGALEPDAFKKQNPDESKIHRLYANYRSTLIARQSVDFDDLLLYPLIILRNHADVLEKYRKRYRFLSIDEFQDTNAAQMELVSLMASPRNNVFAVGDDDQGIYSWRGADISNILSFTNRYEKCPLVILDRNYRSTANIFNAASAVIAHNRHRTIKNVRAVAGEGDPLMHFVGDDEEEEATWIADKIIFHHKHSSLRFSDHAILLRTNALMRRFEDALRHQKIPYKITGGMSFFERKEIKDIVSYLRFFSNTSDELSLLRILKVPDRGVAPSTLEALDGLAALRKMSLWEAILRHEELTGLSPPQTAALANFITFQKKHASLAAGPRLAAPFRALLDECGYLAALKRASRDDAEYADRLANVEEMLHGLDTYETKNKNRHPTLDRFLQELALSVSDNDNDEKESKRGVTLMTLHKSKGLEFPVVFLAGLDRDVIPSPRSVEEGNIEEERRLFYVGMTRAQKQLFLTLSASKVFRGKVRQVVQCSFLTEIPEQFLDGKIGEQHKEDKEQFLNAFFAEMKLKFAEKQQQ